MTTKIQDINSSIMFGNLTNDQLESIIAAVKYARSQLGKTVKRNLKIGDTVKFYSSRSGNTIGGTVDKISISNITVRTNQGLWKVPANMLVVD